MKAMPFLELQRQLQRGGTEALRQVHHEYGDLFYSNPPFLPRIYFAFHPDSIAEVLIKQAQNIGKPDWIMRIFRASFGNGLFSSEGDFWRRQRNLIQPAFHHVHIQSFAERIIAQTQKTIQDWHGGETRTIDKEMYALTFNVVADALFSADSSGKSDELMEAIQDVNLGFEAQGSSLYHVLMPDWAPVPALKRKRRGAKIVSRVVNEMIAERRRLGEDQSPQDLLSILVFARDKDTNEPMSDAQIRDELMTLYIAGHHTTAVLLGWVWALLAQNPEVEAALHREVDTVLGGKTPEMEDLAQMPLVEGVVKETLRLYPPTPGLFREVRTAFKLGDEPIGKGSVIIFPSIAVHHDARWFPDPDSFKPERWIGETKSELPKGAFFPFGLGPRVCIGNGFAMMEAQLIVATIAQQFRLEFLDQPQTNKGIGTLRFAEPVQVRLHLR